MKPSAFNSINNQGQGLIEILAALALGTILILALVSLSLRANRSADSSRIANQASKLAEEGQEIVFNLKNNTTSASTINDATLCNGVTPCNFNALYRLTTYTEASFLESAGATSPLSCTSATYYCLFPQSGGVEPINFEGTRFNRVITFTNATPNSCTASSGLTSAQVVQVRVDVSWTDASGTKTRTTVNCLTNTN